MTEARKLCINQVPQPGEAAVTADAAWLYQLNKVLTKGLGVAPRGQPTRELLHQTVTIDSLHPVVTTPERRLGYRFMATEALWILSGRNDLKMLADVLPRYASYSDDGVTLAGAYGPRIKMQLDWVIAKLVDDPDTRQAVLTIWDRCPAPSKDVPCTVSMAFSLRGGQLHSHVYMRSSDVWMGLPYDLFSFSAVLWLAAIRYNRVRSLGPLDAVTPGNLSVTATSSHLYKPEWENAMAILQLRERDDLRLRRSVIALGMFGHTDGERELFDALQANADGVRDPRLLVLPA